MSPNRPTKPTPDWEKVRADLARMRQRQGLPPVVRDPEALRQAARIIRGAEPAGHPAMKVRLRCDALRPVWAPDQGG